MGSPKVSLPTLMTLIQGKKKSKFIFEQKWKMYLKYKPNVWMDSIGIILTAFKRAGLNFLRIFSLQLPPKPWIMNLVSLEGSKFEFVMVFFLLYFNFWPFLRLFLVYSHIVVPMLSRDDGNFPKWFLVKHPRSG